MTKRKLRIRHAIVVNMPYKLLAFLVRENSLSEFVNNFINGTSAKNYFQAIEDMKRLDAIKIAFIWNKTPEGFDYWYTLYEIYYFEEFEGHFSINQ